MKLQDIIESSGYSLEGSWTRDLVFSKLWLARTLKQLMRQLDIDQIPVAYVLGSWYGNLSIVLRRSNVAIDQIINVEKNQKWLRTGQQMQQQLGLKNITAMHKDANRLDYRQLGDPGLVINTSLNDVRDQGWFEHIPPGTLVILQGRDAIPNAAHSYSNPRDIVKHYNLEPVFYQGTMDLTDPETDYTRSMVIGLKP
jgi:hypothetical protein